MPNEKNSPLWYVYILRCSDDSLYTGITTDVDRRVSAHNSGKGAKYTRSRRPVETVYYKVCGSKSEALVQEAAIKKLPRSEKIKLIEKSSSDNY